MKYIHVSLFASEGQTGRGKERTHCVGKQSPLKEQSPAVDSKSREVGRAMGQVSMNPNTSSLPGGHLLQQVVNGIGGWALVLALIGLVVGAATWALGVHSQNYQHSFIGRRAVLVSGLAAVLIGAAPAIVNFFFHAGQSVK